MRIIIQGFDYRKNLYVLHYIINYLTYQGKATNLRLIEEDEDFILIVPDAKRMDYDIEDCDLYVYGDPSLKDKYYEHEFMDYYVDADPKRLTLVCDRFIKGVDNNVR